MAQNIAVQYIGWHYFEMPKNIWRGWRNFLEFGLNYFSTLLLLRTLFSPWRRYRYDYPRGFDPGAWFNTFTFNLMSRGIGSVMRVVLICVGLLAELFIFAAGAVVFALWILMPAIIVASLFVGIALLI